MVLKHRLYLILEGSDPTDLPRRVVDACLVLLILANVVAVVAETVQPAYLAHRTAFQAFEIVSVALFTLEYVLRLWVCDQLPALRRRGPLAARLRYAVSPFALIDLLAILPFFLGLFLPSPDLRILRVFRLLRLLKLVRYSPALATLLRVIVDERRALAAALIVMVALMLTAATAMYYVERGVQPEAFGSIPSSLWWAVSTLTTVGYGDVVPITVTGKVIGVLVMIFGLGMFALPIGIMASGFTNEIHRHDLVTSWSLVARVPLFAHLDALLISRVSALLRARVVPHGRTIVRRGAPADSMYILVHGEVELDSDDRRMILGEGDFFGDRGLLAPQPYRVTARSLTPCRLLVLDYEEFADLMRRDPVLRETVLATAASRAEAVEAME